MIKNNEKTPLVAIRCTIYNHEPYLRDCLEGFVMQKTNFPFVAIVHDDASTDGSTAIIREYAEKYPDIIKPIYETENQYSKRDGSLGRIMNAVVDATGAKYIAMCEGDDYWTDSYKLQKQVDFMESNPDYSICFHKANTLILETGEIKEEFLVRDMLGESAIIDLLQNNYIHTPTVLYRRYSGLFDKLNSILPCFPGDYVTWMLIAEYGKIYKLDETMAVYRYGSGIWTTNDNYIHKELLLLNGLSKLLVIMENDRVKTILKEQINNIINSISKEFNHVLHDYNQIVNSKAYKLGKFILSPFKK